MAEIAKLAQIISNGFEIQNKKIEALTQEVKKAGKPVVNVSTPPVRIPDVNLPEIKLPTINVPEMVIPEIVVPDIEVPTPEVNITTPDVIVDVSKIEQQINKLLRKKEPKDVDLDRVETLLAEMVTLIKTEKPEVVVDYTEILEEIRDRDLFDSDKVYKKLKKIFKDSFNFYAAGPSHVSIRDDTTGLQADVITATDDDTDLDGLNGVVNNSILSARINSDTVKPLRMDASTHSIQTINYEHHEIHSGSHYFVKSFAQIPALGDVLDFTWQMSSTTSWTHWNWTIETSKGVTWYIYEGAVATNPLANAITPINSNRNSDNTSGTTMKYEIQADLDAANADTDVSSATLIAAGITGDNRTGGSAERNNEIVLKQSTLYCLRAVATAASNVNFDMQWYEHTDKD